MAGRFRLICVYFPTTPGFSDNLSVTVLLCFYDSHGSAGIERITCIYIAIAVSSGSMLCKRNFFPPQYIVMVYFNVVHVMIVSNKKRPAKRPGVFTETAVTCFYQRERHRYQPLSEGLGQPDGPKHFPKLLQ